MILCQVQGGLGNQLFQIYTTIAASVATGQPFGFFHAIHKTNTQRNTYWDSFLSALQAHVVSANTKYKRVYEEPAFHFKPFFRALQVYNPLDNIRLQGYFQSYKYFEQHNNFINMLLQVPAQRDQVRNKLETTNPFLQCDTTVSMHFRLGDYVKLQKYHNVLPLTYYRHALQYVLDHSDVTSVLYFNEPVDQKKVESWITTLSKEFPHVQFFKIMDGLEDWEECLAMSCCQHNIIGNSTFSWWGAFLNDQPSKIVCYPSVWFGPANSAKDTRDLFPDAWIQVEVDKKYDANDKKFMKHSRLAKNSLVNPIPIPTMVWSGGSRWMNSKAHIVALSSYLPGAISTFNTTLSNVCSNPGTSGNPVTPAVTKTMPGYVTLSVGGSNAQMSGWLDMVNEGVNAWVTLLTSVFTSTGIVGLDWDMEGINGTQAQVDSVYTFIGQLSLALKKAVSGTIITFTMFGNYSNSSFPSASFLNTYADACDYVPFMLYNGGTWVDDPSHSWGSWCQYGPATIAKLPLAMQKKVLYGLYPKGGTYSCCAPCIQQVVDFIRSGLGAGVAFWCYDGWLGACNSEASLAIVEAWVEILNAGGGNGVADFEVAYPNSSCTDSPGNVAIPSYTTYNGCGYNYTCDPTTKVCTQSRSGQYHTSTCDGACTAATMYSCVNGACTPTPGGAFPDSTCGGGACSGTPVAPTKYGCVNGKCQLSPTGTYPDSTCGGTTCPSTNTYGCSNGQCTQMPNGPYSDSTCGGTVCPSAKKYGCVNGVCQVSATGTYADDTCGGVSCSASTMYSCVEGVCREDPSGKYPDSTCNKMCYQPLYDCIGGACTESTIGPFTSPSCNNTCGSTLACGSLGFTAGTSFCGVATEQFTCNGENRCCCFGSHPYPTAVNPTSCSTDPTPVIVQMYVCNADGSCSVNPNGTMTQENCKNTCQASNYACVNGTCTAGSGTMTYADCMKTCTDSSYLYECNKVTFSCSQTPSGLLTKEHCSSTCVNPGLTKYKCVNGACKLDPNGIYPDNTCGGVSCETPTKYGCVNGKCQLSLTGTFPDNTCGACSTVSGVKTCTVGTCGAGNITRYDCSNGTCSITPNGRFLDDKCGTGCGSSTYGCNPDGSCSQGVGSQTMSQCSSSCKPQLYSCSTTDYTCQQSPTGTMSKADCQTACAKQKQAVECTIL